MPLPDPAARTRATRLARLTAEVRALELSLASEAKASPSRAVLERLGDPGRFALELGYFMGHRLNGKGSDPLHEGGLTPFTGIQAGGLREMVTALTTISGRPAIFTTVPCCTDHPDVIGIGVRKLQRAQEIGLRCLVPLIYRISSAQECDPVVPARMLAVAALLKSLFKVPQVVLTEGPACSAGMLGALAGQVLPESDGGVCQLRQLLARGPSDPGSPATPVPPLLDGAELYQTLPNDHRMSYDMRRVLSGIVDGDGWQEFQPDVAPEMICANARIDGIEVGVLANARGMFREPRTGAPRIGGIIYTETAEKCAYFIDTMDRDGIPILFVQDVSGFMLGVEAEHSGIIRAGARFVEAMATARVPRLVLTINHASGAGYYAMAAQGFEPDFLFTWPTGRMGAMEGESAVNALFAPQLEALRRSGQKPDAVLQARMDRVRADYERWLDARTAASSGFVDAIIAPEDTRPALSLALRAALENRGSHLIPCRMPLGSYEWGQTPFMKGV